MATSDESTPAAPAAPVDFIRTRVDKMWVPEIAKSGIFPAKAAK